MYDTTGVGWNAHMGFGISVLLNVFGPDSFRAPQSLAIYREIRLFEISRAALFQQPTILSHDKWLSFDQRHRIDGGGNTVLEAAFDLFLKHVILHQKWVSVQQAFHDLRDINLDSIEQSNKAHRIRRISFQRL
jgi:hypothetical protein